MTDEKVIEIATWMVDNCSSLRAAEKQFEVSRSNISRYFQKKLPSLDPGMYMIIKRLYARNMALAVYTASEAAKQKHEEEQVNATR